MIGHLKPGRIVRLEDGAIGIILDAPLCGGDLSLCVPTLGGGARRGGALFVVPCADGETRRAWFAGPGGAHASSAHITHLWAPDQKVWKQVDSEGYVVTPPTPVVIPPEIGGIKWFLDLRGRDQAALHAIHDAIQKAREMDGFRTSFVGPAEEPKSGPYPPYPEL